MRVGCGFSAFPFSVNPETQYRRHSQSIQPRRYVIEDDAPTLGQLLELACWEWLDDIEKAKEDEGDEAVTQVGRTAQQGDPLTGNFIDYNKLRIVTAASLVQRWRRLELLK